MTIRNMRDIILETYKPMQKITDITLAELLESTENNIYRHAIAILKELKKQEVKAIAQGEDE